MIWTREPAEMRTHDDILLRGWLYRPSGLAIAPGIVMSHGFSATKEMGLEGHAEQLAKAGFAILLYDHRNLGSSGGEPRQLIDGFVQTRDMMAAIDWLQDQPGIDGDRIGLWGTSFSGAQVLILGALDSRVRAVVAIVPAVGNPGAVKDGGDAAWASLAARVRSAELDPQAAIGPRSVVPAPDALPIILLPDVDTGAFMLSESARSEGRWCNAVLTAAPGVVPFDPAPALPRLHARALLIAASEDKVIPAADVRSAVDLAGGKADLIEQPGHHCTFYSGEPRRAAARAAADFFARWL